jgi:hypothetical protein
MSVRSCKVTIEDMNGVRHTVDVTAESLYEAVALGLGAMKAIRPFERFSLVMMTPIRDE